MSCGPVPGTYRLLDRWAGWEPASAEGLDGADVTDGSGPGLTLSRTGAGRLDPSLLLACRGAPRLARGCGPGDRFLASPDRGLLRRDPCGPAWPPVRPAGGEPGPAVAVGFRAHVLAAAYRDPAQVRIWTREGEHLRAVVALAAEPSVVAVAPWGEVLVGVRDRVLRLGLDGRVRAEWALPHPVTGIAFTVGVSCAAVVVTDDGRDVRLWRVEPDRPDAADVTATVRAADVEPNGVAGLSGTGFCLRDPGPACTEALTCWDWNGCPLPDGAVPPGVDGAGYRERGQLLTGALDGGEPECVWHRVRVDADVPQGTSVGVAFTTSEDPDPATVPGTPDPGWAAFAPGVGHPADWQSAPDGVTDVLVRRPPGRFLRLRLRLAGDGTATPVVRRVRLDHPRSTSLERLPGVYRSDPETADFTARFLSLFDAVVGDLDDVLDRYPDLLDADGVPDAVLPWLAGLVGMTFDPAWPPARRRALLAAAPELYRRRGTPDGLRAVLRLVSDVDPVVEERGRDRPWGALGRTARLRAVRLFGRSRSRFRIGSSALSRTPLRAGGAAVDDPGADAAGSGAHRFVVHLPPVTPAVREQVERLVASQAPAHTVGEVRVGRTGLVVGDGVLVGIGTVLGALPAPVLGGRNGTVRLNRSTVLWGGRRGPRPAWRVGESSVVGVHTSLE